MSKLTALADLQFEVPPTPSAHSGARGLLKWIPITQLMVDESYQRPIDASGKRNIRRIIEAFHWSQFSPLVVSPRHGGVFAVIDGQHRAVGAKLHGGIVELPCLVMSCTPEEEARAFSTINGLVTRMHPQYLFRARIAAGDAGAVAADEAARAAGARIMPYPVAANQMKVGETLSGKTIENELGRVGRAVVIAAIEIITQTGDGNAGMIKAAAIEAFCDVLFGHPLWTENRAGRIAAVDKLGLTKIFADAARSHGAEGGTLRAHLGTRLTICLRDALGDGGKHNAPTKFLGEQARVAARRAIVPAQVEAAQREQDVLRAAKASGRPLPPGRATVNKDERAQIEAHLKKHGARVYGQGDTADDYNLCEYLKRKGFEVVRNTRGRGLRPYSVNGRGHDRDAFLALVNKMRAKDKLPPIGAVAR